MYTPPEAAFEILERRRKDPEINSRVVEYLGNLLPTDALTEDSPVAILARYVPRATNEDLAFADAAQEAGFTPYWASYLQDRFTTRNPEKVATARPPIQWRRSQKTRAWIVEPDKRVGGVGKLQTIYGMSSSDFQQNVREIVLDNSGQLDLAPNRFDMGQWYAAQAPRFGYEQGPMAQFYYPALMALTTTFCILYEDFDGGPNAGNGDLATFRESVVLPAIEKVRADLGLNPVIVRLPFQNGMGDTNLSFLDGEDTEEFRRNGLLPISAME